MGDDYVAVSPETLRLVGGYLDEPIRIVTETSNQYLTETTGLGPVWGDDHYGEQWAQLYVPAHNSIIETHDSIQHGLVGWQNDLFTMADNYDTTDTYNQA